MRVPIYERQIGVNPVQHAPVSPVYTGDSGAGMAKTLEGLAARLENFQADTEDARTLELINKFKMDSQEYHENPDTGIYNTRLGYSASGVYSQSDEWLRQRGEFYARELKSERAKKNFRKMASEHILQRGQQNSRFEAEQSQAVYDNGLEEIAKNPYDDKATESVKQNMMSALELKHRYSSPEVRQKALDEMESDIAGIRLNAMIKDAPVEAEKWFKENKKLFTKDSAAKFEKAVKDAAEVYKIQDIVDQLVKTYPQGKEQEGLK